MIIGIDPGANTGIAIFQNGKLESLHTITPGRLEEFIRSADRVIFEDSRLQSHMWTTAMSRPVALSMARKVGQVDAWSCLITEICDGLGIPCHGISPKGKGKKLDAKQFFLVTGWDGRSNQHERDSAMIAYPYRMAST